METIIVFTLCNIHYTVTKALENNDEDNVCVNFGRVCILDSRKIRKNKFIYTPI